MGKAYDSKITQFGIAMKAIVAIIAIALPLCSFAQTIDADDDLIRGADSGLTSAYPMNFLFTS
jgi:hypothetical protein